MPSKSYTFVYVTCILLWFSELKRGGKEKTTTLTSSTDQKAKIKDAAGDGVVSDQQPLGQGVKTVNS